MPDSVKGFFKVDKNMVEVLLMLTVLFTQKPQVENLFSCASSTLNPAFSSAIIFSATGFSLFSIILSMTLLGWQMRLIVL